MSFHVDILEEENLKSRAFKSSLTLIITNDITMETWSFDAPENWPSNGY